MGASRFQHKGGSARPPTLATAGGDGAGRARAARDRPRPQAHLALDHGIAATAESSIYGFYRDGRNLSGLVARAATGWDAVGAHLELAKVDTQFGKGPNILNRLRHGLARESLSGRRQVVIDCSPMLGVLSLSAIFAADRVLIPVAADYLAVKGALQVARTLDALQRVLGGRVARRFVITRFDGRRRMSWDILETLKRRFGVDLCESRISENVGIAESPYAGKDVFGHAPGGRGAADYRALFEELTQCGFLDARAAAEPAAA